MSIDRPFQGGLFSDGYLASATTGSDGWAAFDDATLRHSTFPIIEHQDRAAHGRYLSRDLCLAWMNALDAGRPDAEIAL